MGLGAISSQQAGPEESREARAARGGSAIALLPHLPVRLGVWPSQKGASECWPIRPHTAHHHKESRLLSKTMPFKEFLG